MRPLPGIAPRLAALLLLAGLAATATAPARAETAAAPAPPAEAPGVEIGIVVGADPDPLLLDAWHRAALEQGLPVGIVSDAAIQDEWFYGRHRHVALVLPDGLLRTAPPAFVAGIYSFVERGGQVLVVFDAATLGPEGYYAPARARLSALVGIDYGLYDRLKEATFRLGDVYATAHAAQLLGLPPGKVVEDPAAAARAPFTLRLATYQYEHLVYPSFATQGTYAGEPLLESADGQVVAGIRSHGRGRVIFANLPLGGLKLRTDGWLLNRFLRLLATESGLPTLAMTPSAVGGLVMNLHVDAGAALAPLKELAARHLFDDGPFSIHVTAGPDLNDFGDKLGLDLAHNPELQGLLRHVVERGHEVGSHGGWMHNYWATHVTAASAAQHHWLLDANAAALADVVGAPIRVFSAPAGVHPAWVTDWLDAHHYVGYYTTANSGAAPTRTFRDGVLEDRALWSFPIMSLGVAASFEEASLRGMDERREVTPWLESVTRFAAEEHEARLVYFHPTGTHFYEDALSAWTTQARTLEHAGRFRWYTIAGLSEFLDRREQAHWTIVRKGVDDRIEAAAAQGLRELAWLVPAERYGRPRIVEGSAAIRREGGDWIISTVGGDRLVFDVARRAALGSAESLH